MADDRGKKRAATHKDYAFDRAKSEPGIPNVELDEETTQPPQQPPGPEAFAELPLTAKVDVLHATVSAQGDGLARVWDARHVVVELAELKASHKQLATVVAQDTQQVTDLIRKFDHWGRMSKEAWDRSQALSEKQIRLDERLAVFFDEQFPELIREFKAANAKHDGVSRRVDDVESDVADIKAEQTKQAAAIVALQDDVKAFKSRDTEKAIRIDERRRWFSYITKGRAALVAGGAAVALVITKGHALLAWLGF